MYQKALSIGAAFTLFAWMGVCCSSALAAPTGAGAGDAAVTAAHRYAKPTRVSFAVEYDASEYYGPVRCHGKHETNERRHYPGTETEGGRDVEKCTSTTGGPLVGLTPGAQDQTMFPNTSGGSVGEWESDYFSLVKGIGGVDTSDFSYDVSGNGKSFTIVAYY